MNHDWSIGAVLQRVIRSVIDPEAVAKELMSLKLSRETLWAALALACVLSSLQFSIIVALNPLSEQSAQPIVTAVIFTSLLIATVFVLFYCGRAFGGTGGFGDTIAVMAWFQFTMFILQFVQLVIMAILPASMVFLAFVGFFISFRVLVGFVNALHAFGSPFKALGVIVVSFFGVGMGLAVIISFISAVAAAGV